MEGTLFLRERLVVPERRWLLWLAWALAPVGAGVAALLFALLGVVVGVRFGGRAYWLVMLGARSGVLYVARTLVQRLAARLVVVSSRGVEVGPEACSGVLTAAYAWSRPPVAHGEAALKHLVLVVSVDGSPVVSFLEERGQASAAPPWPERSLAVAPRHFSVEGTEIDLEVLAAHMCAGE